MEETVVAPGLGTTTVATAPPDVDHESKRVELYDGTESGMVDRMGHLREQTVAKNKEFLRQITALSTRREKLHERIQKEVDDRKEQLDGIQAATSVLLADLKAEFEAAVAGVVKEKEEKMEKTSARLDADVVVEKKFYEEEVPKINEDQTGEMIRRMLRSRESFDIDNTNLRTREAAMIARFQRHVDATAERFDAEAEDRYNTSTALREALGQWVSTSDRDEAISQSNTVKALKAEKDSVAKESDDREVADGVVLDNLQTAMQQAQAIILENFGSM